jgi:hypothetical protein
MKKTIFLSVLILLALVVVKPALAEGAGKAPLYNSPSYTPGVTCPNGADITSGSTFGFVVMNINHKGDLIVEVSLKGATPNSTYDIWVNQDPGTCPLSAANGPGLLVTNRNGNGNAHLKLPSVPGATKFWVSATDGVLTQTLRSSALALRDWTFTASDSLYYNGPDSSYPLYGTGAINFSWDPVTGNVTGGYYNEIVPPTTGTTYQNVVTGGSVSGSTVNLTFSRTVPNIYSFTFTGTLSGNVLSGQMDGPYLFTATAN